jgi:hypothetical protein
MRKRSIFTANKKRRKKQHPLFPQGVSFFSSKKKDVSCVIQG